MENSTTVNELRMREFSEFPVEYITEIADQSDDCISTNEIVGKPRKNITTCIPGIIFIILGILVPILTHNLTFRKRKVDTIEKSRKGSSSHSSVGGGGSRIKSIISLLSE